MHKPSTSARNVTASDALLADAVTAHALLNLAALDRDEERRFRAILKAEQVIGSMDSVLLNPDPLEERFQSIAKARNELQTRLDRAMPHLPE